ncbi:MAG: hypothetical protein CVV32_12265 [Methanomicrobiales archaeon HGW-Methanomicrobiales-3]|jgi:PKD repeat protein|nr:MAG: hypothetical protein CVV32_12265 [Methanomicrobiales archaeon HGW-Methanomicrobiales-3]
MTCSKKGAHILFLVAMMAFVISGAAADQPVADFSVQDSFTQGFAPFTAWFLDHSTNAASWSWSFGDGQASTEQNPEHTYSNPGTYTVSLTVTDATGTLSDTKTVTDLIVVGADPMGGGTDTPQTTTTVTPVITTTATTIPATTELPAHYGTIAVLSRPAGAMVTLDGVTQGITPITLYSVPAGSHTVLVHLKGYPDYQTSVTVEHGQTVSLDVNLEPVTTTKTTTTTLLPTATTTRVPTVMETSTAEAMKAAAAPGSESGPGSIRINCAGCLERKSGGTPVSFIHYMILSVHYPDGKETKQVMYSEYRTEEAVKTEVPPGYYEVRVWPEDYKAQSRYITVRQSEESAVVFNGSGFVQTPGFGALIAVLTVALIAGLRRFQFGS